MPLILLVCLGYNTVTLFEGSNTDFLTVWATIDKEKFGISKNFVELIDCNEYPYILCVKTEGSIALFDLGLALTKNVDLLTEIDLSEVTNGQPDFSVIMTSKSLIVVS